MCEFSVYSGNIKIQADEIKGYSGELNSLREEVDSISRNLAFKSSSAARIVSNLKVVSNDLLLYTNKTDLFSTSLSSIAQKYEDNEKSILLFRGELEDITKIVAPLKVGSAAASASAANDILDDKINEDVQADTDIPQQSKFQIESEIALLKLLKFYLKYGQYIPSMNPTTNLLRGLMNIGDSVVSIGPAVSGGTGIGGVGSAQFVMNKNGDISVQGTLGGTVTTGADFGGGVTIGFYPNLGDIQKTAGPATTIGGSVTLGVGLGLDLVCAGVENEDITPIGIALTISAGGGAEGHVGFTNTWGTDTINVYDVIDTAISELERQEELLG